MAACSASACCRPLRWCTRSGVRSCRNDTLIGVFLALTLGLGLCLLVAVTRQFNVHQVEAILFGSLLTVTDTDLVLLGVAAIGVAFLLFRHYNDLLLDSLSPPLATARGINRPTSNMDSRSC